MKTETFAGYVDMPISALRVLIDEGYARFNLLMDEMEEKERECKAINEQRRKEHAKSNGLLARMFHKRKQLRLAYVSHDLDKYREIIQHYQAILPNISQYKTCNVPTTVIEALHTLIEPDRTFMGICNYY